MSTKPQKKICFVISPIGDEDSDTRKRSDKVLKHIITISVESLGYEIIRADKISEPGIITTQIIQHIVDADLVIADLTERNPNVFYELALRHVSRKPLIQLMEKGEPIPFDVAASRIIQFDIQDLDSVAAAKAEIVLQVSAVEAGKSDFDNPISTSLDLKMLRESSNPEERSLADVVEAISDLRLIVDKKINGVEGGISSKALDEIKGMIDNLPSRLEKRMDFDLRYKRRRFHPAMFEELDLNEKGLRDTNLSFLMLISFLKDDFPWIYEIGLETYKGLKAFKTIQSRRKLLADFEKALETLRNPMIMEFYGRSEESFILAKELGHYLFMYLEKQKGRLDQTEDRFSSKS